MKAYVNWQCPLWRLDNPRVKHFDIPVNTVVDAEESTGGRYRVRYVNAKGVEYYGMVDEKYIEPYIENTDLLPKDVVYIEDIQTPDPNDAQQYILWQKYTQVNMCGQLSVCYALDDMLRRNGTISTPLTLSEMLTAWEQKQPPIWKKLFQGKQVARGTYSNELLEMAQIYDVGGKVISSKEYPKYTLRMLNELCETGYPIVSCHIDNITGRLRGSGVLHWVVVDRVYYERQYGAIRIYNPYPNRFELYDAAFAIASFGAPYGVLIGSKP